jgi:NhaA family Na+:H+ antiporter
MNRRRPPPTSPLARVLRGRTLAVIERRFHPEVIGGVLLLSAAVAAMVWANSPAAAGYQALLHTPIVLSIGHYAVSQSLHFWINDALMTVFFLVVGMEIRHEIHEGALASLRLATLPLAAAFGGVVVPAFIYLALNFEPIQRQGWAVPTATDIAFALGVLALLGRSIPGNVRIFLLALAIIDDVIAVLIIAFFYSAGLEYAGLLTAGLGVLMVLGLQAMGAGSAYAYILPGAVLWLGLIQTGAHPALAGVALGLMTPVLPARGRERTVDDARRAVDDFRGHGTASARHWQAFRQLGRAQRDLLPPVTRVRLALHPWVNYGVMPLFALANAGVSLGGADSSGADGAHSVMLGVLLALVLGKPLGIMAVSWFAVRLGWCRLPAGVTWTGVCLVGLLAGMGFTMSIFIATLAFDDETLLASAKLAVLLASFVAAVLGLVWGRLRLRHLAETKTDD